MCTDIEKKITELLVFFLFIDCWRIKNSIDQNNNVRKTHLHYEHVRFSITVIAILLLLLLQRTF